MTTVTIDMRDPLTGAAPAKMKVVFTPTKRLGGVGRVESTPVVLENGVGEVDLIPTDDPAYGEQPWSYKVAEYWPNKDGVYRHVLVPTSAEPLDYDALTEVGESAVPPGPDALWWHQMDQLNAALESGDLVGPQGDEGPPGPSGLSAYQIAVLNGYPGNEASWLASLKGADGADGDKGDPGEQGEQGPPGPPGEDGANAPATATPLNVGGSASVGTSVKFAREDHVHAIGAGAIGTSQIVDTAVTYPKLSLDDGDIPQSKVDGLTTALETLLASIESASGIELAEIGTYSTAVGAKIYIGNTTPTAPIGGSIWFVLDADPDPEVIPEGLRAIPNEVGYIGAPHAPERTINSGDTLPSEFFPSCTWDGAALRVNSSNLTIDGWQINAAIDCYGTNLTVRNSIINGNGTHYYGILCRNGDLTVEDTTVTGAADITAVGQALANDDPNGHIWATRCDLSGYQDSVGIAHGKLTQCWIHDIALAGSMHSDGIQIFGSADNDVTIEHCYIDITSPDGSWTDEAHQNACIYFDAPTGPAHNVTINNCFLIGGVYAVMLSSDPQGVNITNCDWAPTDAHTAGEFTATSGTELLAWSNNRKNYDPNDLTGHPGTPFSRPPGL